MLMHHLLYDGAARHPGKVALGWVDRGLTLSFAEAVAEMEAFAGALAHLGVGKGDRVTFFAHNGMDYLTGMFACWRLGAIAAPVNLRFASELAYYLADHTPRVIVYTHDMGQVVRAAVAAVGLDARLICMDGPQEGAAGLPELLAAKFAPPPDPADETAIAHLSYTSGTTGRPKGACLSHEPTMRAANCIAERLRIADDDVSFGPTALSSSYQLVGNLLPPLHRGASVNVMGRWTQQTGFDTIVATGATLLIANPPLLAEMLDEARRRGAPPGRLRLGLSGGGPVPPTLKRAWRDELGLPLVESYGQSELGGFVALGAPVLLPDDRLAPVGCPLPDKEVRIFDAADRELPVGVVGEICLRGGFMWGYWGRPEKTAEALRGGWLHTGDAGNMDAAGYVTMRGRFAELVSVAGVTWYPRDVEEALAAEPEVREAALIGLPGGTAGERPVAYITVNAPVDLDGLKQRIAGRLAFDITPLAIAVIDAFPMTPTGKIAKAELKALASGLPTQRLNAPN